MERGPARLVIRRPRGGYRDLLRSYRIEVDGVLRGTLRRGAELSLEVSPGVHFVRARIDWTGSPELDVIVAEGETKGLKVEAGGNAMQMYHSFRRGSYLNLFVES